MQNFTQRGISIWQVFKSEKIIKYCGLLPTFKSRQQGSRESESAQTPPAQLSSREIYEKAQRHVHSGDISGLSQWLSTEDQAAKTILAESHLSNIQLSPKHTLGRLAVGANKAAALQAIEDYSIAARHDSDGWSFAHEAALQHEEAAVLAISKDEILKIKDEEGISVAQIAVDHHNAAAKLLFAPGERRQFLGIKNNDDISVGQIAIIRWRDIAKRVLKDEKLYSIVIISHKRPLGWTYGHEAVLNHMSCARWVRDGNMAGLKDINDGSGRSIYDIACGVMRKYEAEKIEQNKKEAEMLSLWERLSRSALHLLRRNR